MCGIFCSFSRTHHIRPDAGLQRLLARRGPDSYCARSFDGARAFYLILAASVLALRGPDHMQQPYTTGKSGLHLCWNGEAWSKGGQPILNNDTEAVYDMMVSACSNAPSARDPREDVRGKAARISSCLSLISGPYAFVLYDEGNERLFWGRDFLGRRSLLVRGIAGGDLLLSSVTDGVRTPEWSEVEADGIYFADLRTTADQLLTVADSDCQEPLVVGKVPYQFRVNGVREDRQQQGPVLSPLVLNKTIPTAHALLIETSSAVQKLEELLRSSMGLRVLSIADPPPQAVDSKLFNPARLAILFSGGLDCTVLACLAHNLLLPQEPIDLINAAFHNPRIHKGHGNNNVNISEAYELCPDRITGRSSLAELQSVCPGRIWRFIAVNVPYSETLDHREKVITLMHPHNTEMDLSISYALYFASRGSGFIEADGRPPTEYTTGARILLSGLGADELFAGYQRHASAYGRNGYAGLLEELDLDIGRLGKRNLGRDDRVISNWGREARYPYLDEKLLKWALAAPLTDKCGFGEPKLDATGDAGDVGMLLEPGKKVLRCLAWKLGMHGVAKEKKRAIQFGARTAKMETGKTKGTQILG